MSRNPRNPRTTIAGIVVLVGVAAIYCFPQHRELITGLTAAAAGCGFITARDAERVENPKRIPKKRKPPLP